MPRKGENIYKRKDGRWEGRYIKDYSGKKAIYGYVYSKSYSELKKQLTIKKGEYLAVQKNSSKKSEDISFIDISSMWLESIHPSVKESTFLRYRNILYCNVIPRIGDMELCQIDYAVISTLCNELMKTGGTCQNGLAPKTVSDALMLIKQVIRYAARLKYSTDHTVLDVSITIKNKPLRILSIQEEQLLLSKLTENLDFPSLGVYICLFTGIRIGELCSLTWNDISLDSNQIHIHRTMQRIQIPNGDKKTTVIITDPKSECSVRNIPIAAPLREILVSQPVKEGYVLTGKRDKYVEPRTMQNRFKVIADQCNIKNIHFHTLRHTFATRCIEAGFDVKCLSEILGHANVNITLNRYVHPSMELKQTNMDRLSSLLSVK